MRCYHFHLFYLLSCGLKTESGLKTRYSLDPHAVHLLKPTRIHPEKPNPDKVCEDFHKGNQTVVVWQDQFWSGYWVTRSKTEGGKANVSWAYFWAKA
jgi:hypothetical protein